MINSFFDGGLHLDVFTCFTVKIEAFPSTTFLDFGISSLLYYID
jgi:hypothetical protein